MPKLFKLICFLLIFPSIAYAANGTITGFCQDGGKKVSVSGLNSTTTVQQSFPACTVNVYLTGTSTPATIYSNAGGTVLANPFTANADGKFLFYAAGNAGLDVVISGGTAPNVLPSPLPILVNVFPSGPNGGATGAFLLNPTSNQTVASASYSATFNFNDCPTCFNMNYYTSGLTDAGNGITANILNYWQFKDYGLGRNNGNPNGVNCNLADCGWNVQSASKLVTSHYKNGISVDFEMDANKWSSGDHNVLYVYPICVGGNTDASGEGCSILKFNGTQPSQWYTGTITATTGTGDQDPTLSGGGQPFNGAYLVDTQTPTTTGNFTGQTTHWNDGTGSTYLYQIPVSNTVTPSTGICKTIDYFQGADYKTELPATHTITCTVIGGKALANGLAWQGGFALPERVSISGAGTPSGGVQTITITGVEPIPVGQYIIQGGTQGALKLDDDYTKAGVFTTYPVYGAPDSSHIFANFVMLGNTQPVPMSNGTNAQTTTSPYTIYPTARVMSLDSNGRLTQLEVNDIPFVVGDTIQIPPHPAYSETMATFNSSQKVAGTRNFPSTGLTIDLSQNGDAFAGGAYRPFVIQTGYSRSNYNCSGCGGWLDAPNAMTIAGVGGNPVATFGSILVADQPVAQLSGTFGGGCAGGTFLCTTHVDTSKVFSLYAEENGSRRIDLDAANFSLDLINMNLRTNSVNFNGGSGNGIIFPSLVAGTYIRCSTSACTPQNIQAADLPVATSSVVGVVKPDNATITITGGVVSTAGFTGSCASTTTLTVVNGLITGCS